MMKKQKAALGCFYSLLLGRSRWGEFLWRYISRCKREASNPDAWMKDIPAYLRDVCMTPPFVNDLPLSLLLHNSHMVVRPTHPPPCPVGGGSTFREVTGIGGGGDDKLQRFQEQHVTLHLFRQKQ